MAVAKITFDQSGMLIISSVEKWQQGIHSTVHYVIYILPRGWSFKELHTAQQAQVDLRLS
jgi:hypothetical protein